MGGGISSPSFNLSTSKLTKNNISNFSNFQFNNYNNTSSSLLSIKKGNNNTLLPLEKRYQNLSVLGTGSFSKVYYGINLSTYKNVAIKHIKPLKTNKNYHDIIKTAMNELNSLKRASNHSNIILLYSAFKYKSSFYIILEYLNAGDLRYFLRKSQNLISEKVILYIVCCIGSALNHIHLRGVIHRDIKPENIGLDLYGRPYLMDFGISMISSSANPIPICCRSSGTLAYLAPEVLAPSCFHSTQADFWSLGIIAYELYYKHRPFNPHSPELFIEYTFRVYKNFWKELQTNPMYDYFNKTNLSPELQSTSSSSPENNESIEDDTNLSEEYIIPLPMRTYPITNNNGETNDDIEHENDDDDDDEDGDEDYCHQNLYQPSNELKSLIRGLLDVRIPYRLGSLSNYSQFSNHPSFQRYNYSPTSMDLIKSPIRCFPYKPRKQGSESIFDTDTPDNSEDHESEFNSPASPQLQQQQQQELQQEELQPQLPNSNQELNIEEQEFYYQCDEGVTSSKIHNYNHYVQNENQYNQHHYNHNFQFSNSHIETPAISFSFFRTKE